MRTVCVFSLPLFFFTMTAAFADTENLCAYLSGFWYGTYTFLKHRDCHENHGCTHMLSAEVAPVRGFNYQADLTLQMGRRETVNFTCKDSIITFTDKPDSVNMLTCANGACFVKYQDSTLASTALHVLT